MLKVISTAVSSAIFFAVFTSGTLFAAQAFAQAPGNNGTIKVHEYGTPIATPNNDPKVCDFNIEAFGLDAGQTGYVSISVQGGDAPKGVSVAPVPFGPADASGYAASSYFHLADGHYKVTLYGKDTKGAINYNDALKAKSKVFKVSCEPIAVTPVKATPPVVTPRPAPSCPPKGQPVQPSQTPVAQPTPKPVTPAPATPISSASAAVSSTPAPTTAVVPAELPHTGMGAEPLLLTALAGITTYALAFGLRTNAMRRLIARLF